MKDLQYLRKLDEFEVLEILKEEGAVCGSVIMDSERFIKIRQRFGLV